ncbi:MAG: hypothetical protein J3T61_12505, partial [Candidatus Brocadiales bacterium]|nr:hypothetical protein [Candidatus Bathyanammoxibius sp.]
AFQAVPNTAEITVAFIQNLIPIANVFHAIQPLGYDQSDIVDLAVLVDVAVAANLLPLMTQDSTYLRTEVRGLSEINDLFDIENINTGPGLVVGQGLPNQVTFSIKKSSLKTGRSARGRWFWIGLPDPALATNENELINAEADLRVDAVDAMRLAVEISQWDAVIVSRFTDNAQRPFGVTFPWVTTSKVDNRVDTQRPRLG